MTVNALPDLRVDPEDWEEAIARTDGPQIVVAGPGTGKTEFLVRRSRHLISQGRALPGEVLILTFSRRNSADIQSRSRGETPQPVVATFHSFAYRLLETFTRSDPPIPAPTLLTGPEQVSLVSELLRSENPADWPLALRNLLSTSTLAAEVADFLLRCQERLIGPAGLADRVTEVDRWGALPSFMTRYLDELTARNRLDYGTLLARASSLVDGEKVRDQVAEQYRYVLVDEYQDTSAAQAQLLDRITSRRRNLTVTGDPYQSIYSFRGAELENVARFPAQFRDLSGREAQRIILTQSFRVPAPIMQSALRIVSSGDLPGGAGPVKPAPHLGRVTAFVFDQSSGEADWIAGHAERLHLEQQIPYRLMAVLVRSTRHLFPELSRALDRRAIPHRRPDQRLTDHPAIRVLFDIASASFSSSQPEPGWAEEADRAVRRILLGPLLSIPLGQERELLRTRRRSGRPWSEVLTDAGVGSDELHQLLADPFWAIGQSAADGFWHLWSTLPEVAPIVADPSRRHFRRAFTAFAQTLDQQRERDPSITLIDYQRLAAQDDFEAMPLLSLTQAEGDQLTLTTLHQAKGLEFDVVFIADAAEGVFPNLTRRNALLRPELLTVGSAPQDQVRFRLQEEMRLAYTAMTRARTRVIWTATSAAIDEGERRPSRFVLAASGASSFDELGAPESEPDPVTAAEAQARLRLLLTDPGATSSDRLAALAVVASPPDSIWDPTRFAGIGARGPDHGVIEHPLRLNPTSAETYEQCPRRYVFDRHLEANRVTGPSAGFGSLVHEILDQAEKAALSRGEGRSSAEEALAALDQIWEERADFGSPVLNEAWRRRGRSLIERLYANWPSGDAVGLRCEQAVRLEIDDIVWAGRIDRIEEAGPGRLRIVDYKTGKNQPTKAEAANSLQLAFYLLAVARDPELRRLGEATEAELWYPEADRPRLSFDLVNLEGAIARLGEVAGSILKEDWTPRPGVHCDRCSYRLVCPAWPEGREGYRA